MSKITSSINITPKQLYRDLLNLIDHLAGTSQKGNNLRKIVRLKFKENSKLVEKAEIDRKKEDGLRFITNYLKIESERQVAELRKNDKKQEAQVNKLQVEKEKILKRKEFKNKVLEDAENEENDAEYNERPKAL